jgi:hypothetical protein
VRFVDADGAVRVTAAELIACADAAGAHLERLLPVGFACDVGFQNGWLTGVADLPQSARERLMSWVAIDANLAEFVSFVERAAAESAPPALCAAWFAVFAAGPSPDGHAAIAARIERPFRFEPAWKAPLRTMLADGPVRAFAATLLVRSGGWDALGAAQAALDALAQGTFSRVAAGRASDERVFERERAWTAALVPGSFVYAGVDLRGVFDPDIRAELLNPAS